MRHIAAAVLALVLVSTGCTGTANVDSSSGTESSGAVPTSDPGPGFDLSGRGPDEPILVYWMGGGECSSPCAFRIEVFANGIVESLAYDNVQFTEEIDVEPLIEAIEATSPDQLIVGTDDCGREVDGNAPTLEIGATVIDTCYELIDSNSPIAQLAARVRNRIDEQVPLVGYDVLNAIRAEADADGVDTTSPVDWPTAIEPSTCMPLFAINPDASSYAADIAVEPTEEFCNVWSYQQNNDPYLCPIPRTWPGEVLVRTLFRCPGE